MQIDPRFGLPRWYVGGAVSPTVSPLDFVGAGSAVRVAGNLVRVTAAEAASAARVIWGRMTGQTAAEESVMRIRKAADAVEDFLGGTPRPEDVRMNPKGDIYIINGDRKFRMDVKNPGFKRGVNGLQVPEEPHFHLQALKENGKWVDATTIHRFFFRQDLK